MSNLRNVVVAELKKLSIAELNDMDKEIMRDIPLTGPSQKTDLAAWHQEDEE